MQLKELVKYLEQVAPLSLQESYDNSRLQVGNLRKNIKSALITVDCTEDVIREAKRKRTGVILTHHPLIFGSLKSIAGNNYVERTLELAIRNDIAIYAIHTNLDNIYTGVNSKICDKLGIKRKNILRPVRGGLKKLYTFIPIAYVEKVKKALFKSGAGHIGEYSEASFSSEGIGTFLPSDAATPHVGKKGVRHAEKEVKVETIFPDYLESQVLSALHNSHPYEEVAYDIVSLDNINPFVGSGMIGELSKSVGEMEFLKKIKRVMKAKGLRYTKLLGRKISRVAVCGGAGSFLLQDAVDGGADIFLTSDFKYHQFFDADNKIVIADIGHYESEQFTKELIAELVMKKFPKFALHLSETVTNPVKYL